ncbi:hypothetical protein [Sulfitobacter sediminilitoris]|uniref:hypothetical protein n=1 Tax=Sulfitobacter sediminilitoris TaxID=2698830 RepID=UPI0036123804
MTNLLRFRYGVLVACVWIYIAIQVFWNYPYLRALYEGSIIFSVAGFLVIIGMNLVAKKSVSIFSLYILILVIYIPLQLAYAAALVWGQPMIFGVLARRGDALMLSVAILYELCQRGRIEVEDIVRGLLVVSWFAALIFVVTKIFLDPGNFLEYVTFAKGGSVNPAYFVFTTHILVFLTYYFWTSSRLDGTLRSKMFFLFLVLSLFFLELVERGCLPS